MVRLVPSDPAEGCHDCGASTEDCIPWDVEKMGQPTPELWVLCESCSSGRGFFETTIEGPDGDEHELATRLSWIEWFVLAQSSRGFLTEQQARTFILRDVRGLDRSETADRLAISESTIDAHLSAARDKIDSARDGLAIVDALPGDVAEVHPMTRLIERPTVRVDSDPDDGSDD
jgi:hypothetical protein